MCSFTQEIKNNSNGSTLGSRTKSNNIHGKDVKEAVNYLHVKLL